MNGMAYLAAHPSVQLAVSVLFAMIGVAVIGAAWAGHTDASRARANDLRASLEQHGIKHASAAADMGIASVKAFTRQLGGEPLNLWRLFSLPDDLVLSFLARCAESYGAKLWLPDEVALLRGLAAQPPRMTMLKMLPESVDGRRRA